MIYVRHDNCMRCWYKYPQADMVFADPPQISGTFAFVDMSLEFTDFWIRNTLRQLRPGGIFILCTHPPFTYQYQRLLEHTVLDYHQTAIWSFKFGAYTRKRFVISHMNILMYSYGKPTFNWRGCAVQSTRLQVGDKRADQRGRTPGSVWEEGDIEMNTLWEIPRVNKNELKRMSSMSQLPDQVASRILRAYLKPGSSVIAPFAGAGTIPYMCQRLRINCDAVDPDEKCVAMARKRCQL